MCINGVFQTIGSEDRCCVKHFRTNCGGWNCSECRPMLEALWIEMMELHWSSHRTIGFLAIETEKFNSLRKKIKRHGGNYVRISAGDRLFYILTDDLSVADKEMSVSDAIEKLKWCMHNAPCPKTKKYADNDSEFRVVTTSAGWRQLHRTETFPEYELIGNGIPTEVIERTLVEMGKTFEIVELGKQSNIKALCALLDTPAEYEQFKRTVRSARRCPRSPYTGNPAKTLYLEEVSKDAHADICSRRTNAGDVRLSQEAFNSLSFMFS